MPNMLGANITGNNGYQGGGTGATGFSFFGMGGGPQDSNYMGGNPNLNQYANNPYISALGNMVSQFQPISAGGTVYQAKNVQNENLPQYDAMQARLNQAYNTQQQTAQDAIDRQFAAGGGPSGAQMKQTENLQATTDAQKSQDQLGLAAEEAQTKTALQQQETERAFQSQEAANQRGFQAQEFNAQMPFQEQSTVAGLNTAWDQAQAEAVNNEFNKSIADYQATHSGGLLGGGGLLGTGLNI